MENFDREKVELTKFHFVEKYIFMKQLRYISANNCNISLRICTGFSNGDICDVLFKHSL